MLGSYKSACTYLRHNITLVGKMYKKFSQHPKLLYNLLHYKHKLSILSRLGDFVTCSTHFNIWSEGIHNSTEHCGKIQFSIICSSDTEINKL